MIISENRAVDLRPAQPFEAENLTALARRSKAHWGYSPEFMSACEGELQYTGDQIRSPHYRFVVAEVRGECVGFYALALASANEVELEALFVEPGCIGNGFGRELIEDAKTTAVAGGASILIIQGDPNATRFYEAAGGVLVGRRESGSIPGRHLPVYRIDLACRG